MQGMEKKKRQELTFNTFIIPMKYVLKDWT